MFGFIVLQLKHVILLRTLGMYNTTILVISLHVAELPRHVQRIAIYLSCHWEHELTTTQSTCTIFHAPLSDEK